MLSSSHAKRPDSGAAPLVAPMPVSPRMGRRDFGSADRAQSPVRSSSPSPLYVIDRMFRMQEYIDTGIAYVGVIMLIALQEPRAVREKRQWQSSLTIRYHAAPTHHGAEDPSAPGYTGQGAGRK